MKHTRNNANQPAEGTLFSDLFQIVMIIAACVGFIVILFVGGFIGVCSLTWIFRSFLLAGVGQIVGGLALSLMCLACAALFLYMDYLIARAVIRGTERYLQERREIKSDKQSPPTA